MGGPIGGRRPVAETPEWMTMNQLADYLQLTVDYTRELIQAGRIRSTRTGRQGPKAPYRIRKGWADDYLESRATGGPSAKRVTSRRRQAKQSSEPTAAA